MKVFFFKFNQSHFCIWYNYLVLMWYNGSYPLFHPRSFVLKYFPQDILRQFDPKRDTSKLCRLGVGQCSNSRTQKFKLSWHKDIRYSETSCFDVSLGGNEAPINFYQCHGGQGNQLWRYEKVWTFTAAHSGEQPHKPANFLSTCLIVHDLGQSQTLHRC